MLRYLKSISDEFVMSRRCAFTVWKSRSVSQISVWPRCMSIVECTCNYYFPEKVSETIQFFWNEEDMLRFSSDLEIT